MKPRLIIPLLLACLAAPAAIAQEHDAGLQLSAGASRKFSKRFSAEIDLEMRTRNDFRTMDRVSAGLDASYKIWKYLKVSGGYALLYDNNIEKINYDEAGTITTWRPSYWGFRHRFNVTLTGSLSLSRFSFSLRERWQYTYRPETTVRRYDFDNEDWEDKTLNAKGKNVLRSRLKVEYNIPKCKVDPYVSAELFTSRVLEKTRFIAGADWKISKKHALEVFYRYQIVNPNDDDSERNTHIIGVGYTFKF